MFISDKTKSQFYDYICLFETQSSQEFGKFNLDNANLQHYLQSNDIFLASIGKRNAKECKKHKQYILYDDVSADGLILIESLRPMINLLIASKTN